jgi:hypothetical protein
MTKDIDRPAFPTLGHASGMSLRDYFAAKAMQGVLASGNLPKFTPDLDVAECSYRLADAMLEARKA